jgi:hypothetical protein
MLDRTKNDTSTFKQNYEESLKDAWFKYHKMHAKDPNRSSEAKLNLTYYYGLVSWGTNA